MGMYLRPQSIMNPRRLYSGTSTARPLGMACDACCSESCSRVRVPQYTPLAVAAVMTAFSPMSIL